MHEEFFRSKDVITEDDVVDLKVPIYMDTTLDFQHRVSIWAYIKLWVITHYTLVTCFKSFR